MYKAPLTATVFKDFSSCYLHFSSHIHRQPDQPFVYVDSSGVRYVTNVLGEKIPEQSGAFALSVAEDGWVEMLCLA